MDWYKDYYDYIDHRTLTFLLLKALSKEEFLKKYKDDPKAEEIYEALQKSKAGYIKVSKISNNPGIQQGKEYEGVTGAFGEGLAVWISGPESWFHTSTIESIDWEKNEINTMNSTYSFEFKELDFEPLVRRLKDREEYSLLRQS